MCFYRAFVQMLGWRFANAPPSPIRKTLATTATNLNKINFFCGILKVHSSHSTKVRSSTFIEAKEIIQFDGVHWNRQIVKTSTIWQTDFDKCHSHYFLDKTLLLTAHWTLSRRTDRRCWTLILYLTFVNLLNNIFSNSASRQCVIVRCNY